MRNGYPRELDQVASGFLAITPCAQNGGDRPGRITINYFERRLRGRSSEWRGSGDPVEAWLKSTAHVLGIETRARLPPPYRVRRSAANSPLTSLGALNHHHLG